MCVKLPPGDLNLGPYPPHPTSTYTCGVTTAPRVRSGYIEPNVSLRLKVIKPKKWIIVSKYVLGCY